MAQDTPFSSQVDYLLGFAIVSESWLTHRAPEPAPHLKPSLAEATLLCPLLDLWPCTSQLGLPVLVSCLMIEWFNLAVMKYLSTIAVGFGNLYPVLSRTPEIVIWQIPLWYSIYEKPYKRKLCCIDFLGSNCCLGVLVNWIVFLSLLRYALVKISVELLTTFFISRIYSGLFCWLDGLILVSRFGRCRGKYFWSEGSFQLI